MTAEDLCEYLEWDSSFFGVKVARMRDHRLDEARANLALSWCHERHVDCLYFLADAGSAESSRVAESRGFHLVDIRVTLDTTLPRPAGGAFERPPVEVRGAVAADLPRLRSIARSSYRESRFYADPGFPDDACDRFYETWIEKSCGDFADEVIVAVRDGVAAGYCTCHVDGGTSGHIGLLGVAADQQGMGLGLDLIEASLAWFQDRGIDQVQVVTQGRNVRAQRAYQKCGFRTRSVELWYHRWFRNDDGVLGG